jgi:hypothetical protein
MTLAVLDLPGAATPRRLPPAGTSRGLLPELAPAQWAEIQARLRATGVPPEVQDDHALARTFGASALLGLGLTSLAACGLWGLLA